MLANGWLGPRQHAACLDALVPRVTKFCVTSTSAVSEPRPTATATAALAGVLHGAASGTHITDHGRRRVCWCVHVSIVQGHKRK